MIPLFALALAASDPPAGGSAGDAPPPEMQKLLDECNGHRFETLVDVTVNGQPRKSKVKLCGTPGQTDADWARTLKDAIAKVEANSDMTPAMRGKIVTALNAELAKLAAGTARPAIVGGTAPAIAARPPAPPPGRDSAPLRSIEQDYASMPPLPAPKPAAAAVAGASLPGIARPRMTVRCATSDAPTALDACDSLSANSLLNIRADEALAGDTSLRFVRKGDARGDVALGQLAQGQSIRVALPRRVCEGIIHSSVQIEVVRRPRGSQTGDQLVDTLGPYELRC